MFYDTNLICRERSVFRIQKGRRNQGVQAGGNFVFVCFSFQYLFTLWFFFVFFMRLRGGSRVCVEMKMTLPESFFFSLSNTVAK